MTRIWKREAGDKNVEPDEEHFKAENEDDENVAPVKETLARRRRRKR